jgi:cell division protein FtsZ
MLDEMIEVRHFMDKFINKKIEVIWGLATDSTLDDEVKITVLATGFGMENLPEMEDDEEATREIERIYGERANKRQLYLYDNMSDKDLENDALIDAIEASPSYLRNSVGLSEIKALRA